MMKTIKIRFDKNIPLGCTSFLILIDISATSLFGDLNVKHLKNISSQKPLKPLSSIFHGNGFALYLRVFLW